MTTDPGYCSICGAGCCGLNGLGQCNGAYEGVCHLAWERAYGLEPNVPDIGLALEALKDRLRAEDQGCD